MLTAHRLGCNVIIFDCDEHEWEAMCSTPSAQRRIDVWWLGNATSRLMLLLAHLMLRSREWIDATIRVLTVDNAKYQPQDHDQLKEMLADIRIDADVVVIKHFDKTVLEDTCRDASLVMIPFRLIDKRVSTVGGAAIGGS